jgi:hypothetical protein
MGYFRVIINGTSPFPGEVWSTSLAFIGPNTAAPFATLQNWATGIATFFNLAGSNALVGILSDSGGITQVRVEQRGDDNDELALAAEALLPGRRTGTGTPNKPLQTAVVISLLTGIPGRSYRGRCYWPCWSTGLTTQLMFGTSQLNDWLDAFEEICEGITAAAIVADPAYNMVLAVRSRLLHESNDVGLIAAGTVPDTQRRRRDGAPENYVYQPFPTP